MPDNYFVRYIPLLMHLAVVTIIPLGMVVLSWFVGQHKFNKAKMEAYECGMEPIGDAQNRFSVKFYLVAILFILFDVEAVFMYPWAIIFKDLKAEGGAMFGFSEMLVYVLIVLAGFFYIWKKGAIDWNKKLPGERI
jgi:NADH-quinone oxidoreductase subunit A